MNVILFRLLFFVLFSSCALLHCMKFEDLEIFDITTELEQDFDSISLEDEHNETQFPVVRAIEMKQQSTRVFLYSVDPKRGTKNEQWTDYFKREEWLLNIEPKLHLLLDTQCTDELKDLDITCPLITLTNTIKNIHPIFDTRFRPVGTQEFVILKECLRKGFLGKFDRYEYGTLGDFYSKALGFLDIHHVHQKVFDEYLPKKMASYFYQIIKFDTLWMLTSLFNDDPLIFNAKKISTLKQSALRA